MNLIIKGMVFLLALLGAAGCVPTKKYNQLNAELMRTDNERRRLLTQTEQMENNLMDLNAKLSVMKQEKDELQARYDKLSKDYERLLSQHSDEASRMLLELQQTQEQLRERERKVAELEQMLRNREAALEEIRRKVADALLGFEGKGLTVTQRDGKVYVSMDDKLLFRSGSFDIESNGAAAVRELANVLAQNPDINVMVEGHTDNVPYRGSGQLRDNWDLSVKRATTVARLLLENPSVDPSRITAAGRSEYLPLFDDDSADSRQKNRRTEIILTPKLDELLQLMESND